MSFMIGCNNTSKTNFILRNFSDNLKITKNELVSTPTENFSKYFYINLPKLIFDSQSNNAQVYCTILLKFGFSWFWVEFLTDGTYRTNIQQAPLTKTPIRWDKHIFSSPYISRSCVMPFVLTLEKDFHRITIRILNYNRVEKRFPDYSIEVGKTSLHQDNTPYCTFIDNWDTPFIKYTLADLQYLYNRTNFEYSFTFPYNLLEEMISGVSASLDIDINSVGNYYSHREAPKTLAMVPDFEAENHYVSEKAELRVGWEHRITPTSSPINPNLWEFSIMKLIKDDRSGRNVPLTILFERKNDTQNVLGLFQITIRYGMKGANVIPPDNLKVYFFREKQR